MLTLRKWRGQQHISSTPDAQEIHDERNLLMWNDNFLECTRLQENWSYRCPCVPLLFSITSMFCLGFFKMKNKFLSIIWLRDMMHFEQVPVLPDYWESRIQWSIGNQFIEHHRNSLLEWSSDQQKNIPLSKAQTPQWWL